MLKNYLKIALRNLRKNPGYSFINIFGLALGIAVFMLIFRYIDYETSYDSYHEKADRIYRVTFQMPERHIAVTSSIVSPALQNNFAELQSGTRILAAGNFKPAVLQYKNRLFEESSFAYADSSMFDVFSYTAAAGKLESALNRPETVALSEDMALKLFGDENPIGKTVLLDNEQEFEVTAVFEKLPTNSHFQFDIIASLVTLSGWDQLTDQEMRGQQFYTYMVLQKGASPQNLEKKINAYFEQNFPKDYQYTLHLQPLTDIHLYSDVLYEIQPQGDIRYIWAASAIAFLILIIACINYMNLATARSARRSKDVGVRKVLGAQRNQLIGQFYGESAILVGISLLFAVFIIELILPWFNEMMGQKLATGMDDPFVLCVLLTVGFVVTLVAGSYPAIMLSGFKPVSVLKGPGVIPGNSSLRKVLVVSQFSVSMFLIIATFIISQQVDFMQNKKLGYKKDNVIAVNTPNDVLSHFDAFKSEMLQVPDVNNVTMASQTPINISAGYGIDIAQVEEDPSLVIMGLQVHPEFNETFNIHIVAGRDLRPADYSAVNREENPEYAYLLNETAVRTFGLTPNEILGRSAVMSERKGTIVGVVEDFHFAPLHRQIEPLVMFPEASFRKVMISFNSRDVGQNLSKTKEIWESIFPATPFEYNFLDQQYSSLYQQEKQVSYIFTSFSVVAILIACLGLFGLASFMMEQRKKEIGVRKVLGATVTGIVGLLSKDFLKLVALGFIIAVPIAWLFMKQWLADFAYKIEISPIIFLLAGAIGLLIALATVSWQSIRAALVNPVDSLRSE